MKISKLRVGKGHSKPRDPKDPSSEWLKEFYEIEIEIDLASELEPARQNALKLIDSWLSRKPIAREVKVEKPLTLNELASKLSELAQYVDVKEEADHFILTPKYFLDPDRWQEVTRVIRELNGDWQPAGKDSKWVIPKK